MMLFSGGMKRNGSHTCMDEMRKSCTSTLHLL